MKENKIKLDGNNNLILQDLKSGRDIIVNINDTEALKKLLSEVSEKLREEIVELLQNKTQIADKIYNINHIDNANFS